MDVRVEMHGSSGYCDVNGEEDGLKEVFDFLKLQSGNGLVINGILAWIDVQQKSTPPNIWLAQAASSFCDDEVEIAKAALWKAASNRLDIIGDVVSRRNPDRIERNLNDIHTAMKALKEANAIPLILCSSSMVRTFPAFHCDKNTSDIGDVLSKVMVVEQSLGNFMKQSNDQMKKLANSIAKISQPKPAVTPANRDLINLADTPQTLTPGSKRRRTDDDNRNEAVHGITPINAVEPPVSFRDVTTRNMIVSNQQASNLQVQTGVQGNRSNPLGRPPNTNNSQGY